MRLFAIASILFTAMFGVFAGPIVEYRSPRSVAVILMDLTDTVMPLAQQLLYATPQNATKAILMPIINNIQTTVDGSVKEMKLLAGQPTNVIMGSADGTGVLSTHDLADLLAAIVILILKAANVALSVIEPKNRSIAIGLLVTLGQLVFRLLAIVLPLVDGLLAPTLVLLAPVLSIIRTLGLTDVLGKLLGGLLGGL